MRAHDAFQILHNHASGLRHRQDPDAAELFQQALELVEKAVRERDDLRVTAAALIAAAPKHMTHRNRKERVAYKAFRSLLDQRPAGGATRHNEPEGIMVPDPEKVRNAYRRLLEDLERDEYHMPVIASDMFAAFGSGQARLLKHLLELNPGLRFFTPSGEDVTETYTTNAKSGA